MSLVFSLRFAPVICGGEGKEIPSGLPCPEPRSLSCRLLQKLGRYVRSFKTSDGVKVQISIQRLYCPGCGVSHACLFPCLIPGSGYAAETLGELVVPYLFERKSYEEIGWEMEEEEGQGHKHLVHSVLERLLEKLDWILSFVEKQALRYGGSLWRRKNPERPNEAEEPFKVKSKEKNEALKSLKTALMKFGERSGQKMEKLVCQLHAEAMQSREPVSLLARPRCALVNAPHERGNAPF